jgi:hypothetical protein
MTTFYNMQKIHYNVISCSFPRTQNRNNGNIKNIPKAMPQQFQNSGNSMFSLARHLYTNSSLDTSTKKWQPISSGEKTYLTGSRTIGKSSIQSKATLQELSFRSQDTTSRNSALIRCRAGGCIAPKKKTNNY